MVDDKKKKIVTDEDVSKLLDELLGDVPAAEKPAADMAKTEEIAPREKTSLLPGELPEPEEEDYPEDEDAQEEEVPEEEHSGEFYVEDTDYDPKLEAAREKAERLRARAEVVAAETSRVFGKAKQAAQSVSDKVLSQEAETRRKRIAAIKGYAGFGLALAAGFFGLVYIYIAITLSGEHQYKQQISASIKELTGHELNIEGEVRFEMFPHLRFVIGSTQLKNRPGAHTPYLLTAQSIEIRPSLFWLVLNTVKLKDVVLHDPEIHLENFIGETPNWQWYAAKDGKTGGDASETVLAQAVEDYLAGADIQIMNAKISYYSGAKENPVQRTAEVQNTTLRLGSTHGPYAASGTMATGKSAALGYTLNVGDLAEERPEVTFSVNLGTSAVTMKGTLQGEKGRRTVQGRLVSSVAQKKDGLELPKAFSSMLTAGNNLLEGEFFASREKVALTKVVVNAAPMQGSMDVDIAFGAPNKVTLALQAEKLDLDALFGETRDEVEEKKAVKLHHSLSETLLGVSLPADILARLDARVKAFTYKKQTVSDARVDIETGANSLILHEVNLEKLPGGAFIRASSQPVAGEDGVFSGTLSAGGGDFHQFLTWAGYEPVLPPARLKDFSFESATRMAQSGIALDGIKAAMGGSHLGGTAKLHPGATGIVAEAALSVDAWNAEQGAAPKEPGKDEDMFAPLRKAEMWFEGLDLAFAAGKVHSGRLDIENLTGRAAIADNVTRVSNIAFDSRFGKVAISGSIDQKMLKPQLDIALQMEKADIADLGTLFGMEQGKPGHTRWSESILPVGQLANYGGHVKLGIGKVQYHDFSAEEVNTGLKIADDRMQLEGFRAKVFSSRLKLEGYIALGDHPSASLSFALPNADMQEMLHSLLGLGAMEGKTNFTGSLTLAGLSPYQWISTLQGSVNFVSRGIRIKGVNFTLLSQRLPVLQSVKEVQYWAPRALYTGETDFVYMAGSGRFVQGVFTLTDISLRNSLLKSMDTQLALNLPEWKISLQSNMKIGLSAERAFPTRLTVSSSIDTPDPRWDQKMIETEWEKMFYAGVFGRGVSP